MKKNIFLFLSILIFTASCKYKEVTLGQISGLKINKITTNGLELELGMKINNPNSYGFSIYRSSFRIKLGGADLGTARIAKRTHIKAHSDEVYTFTIKTSFDKLKEDGLAGMISLFSKKNAEIEIKGNLKAGKFLLRKKIPVDRKQSTRMENNAGGGLFNLN
ncbi:MAG: LEA type 2 family protein [Bacteroidia bacterium]